jgi:hypothetical protein
MKAAANGDPGTPPLADDNANHDVRTLALGLVYARTGDARYRQKGAEAIRSVIGKAAASFSTQEVASLSHSAPIDKLAVHTHTTAMHRIESPSVITSAEWAATPPTLQVFMEAQLGAIADLPTQQATLCELAHTPAYTRISRNHRSLW